MRWLSARRPLSKEIENLDGCLNMATFAWQESDEKRKFKRYEGTFTKNTDGVWGVLEWEK